MTPQRPQTSDAGDASLDCVQQTTDCALELIPLLLGSRTEELPLYSIVADQKAASRQAIDQ